MKFYVLVFCILCLFIGAKPVEETSKKTLKRKRSEENLSFDYNGQIDLNELRNIFRKRFQAKNALANMNGHFYRMDPIINGALPMF